MLWLYIKRQISNQQNEINNSIPFDEQNAYDEFLFFCKKAFCSLYPDKSIALTNQTSFQNIS